jgi:pimeloyl-ACP methyl ester carboxylesterase
MKVTTINSDQKNNIHLIIIPGGPGLSSKTLSDLEILRDRYQLHFLDIQGTGEDQYEEKKSFQELCSSVIEFAKTCKGKIYLLGHSFGGLMAMEAANNFPVDGVICLAVPMSKEVFESVSKNYSNKKNDELKKSQVEWNQNPSNETFAKWLSQYGDLYFENDSNGDKSKMLLNDQVSFQFFLDNRGDSALCENITKNFKKNSTKKLFLAGKNDGILPLVLQERDAISFGFNFKSIKNANHFLTVDQPKITATEIKNFIGNSAIT